MKLASVPLILFAALLILSTYLFKSGAVTYIVGITFNVGLLLILLQKRNPHNNK
jgi:hypothetical protein